MMAKQLSAAECAAILKGGHFDQFIGAMESDEFECKAEPYRLDDKRQKFELAKDISSFANARGGMIVVGLVTERDAALSGDVVTGLRLFEEQNINIGQYHDVLNSWLYPRLQTMPEIKWFPCLTSRTKGVIAISIINQPGQWRPFLITKSVEPDGTQSATMFGYAERRVDRSEPMGVQQLHLLIRDGLRTEAGPTLVSLPLREIQPDSSPQGETRDVVRTTQLFNDIGPKRIDAALATANLEGSPAFVLAAVPDQPTEIPELFIRQSDVVKLMENPPRLRQGGFTPDAGADSRIIGGQLRHTLIAGHRVLELWRDGTLIFAEIGDEDGLSWGSKVPDAYKMNQLALIETTLQFVALAGAILAYAHPAPAKVKFFIELRRMVKNSNNAVLSCDIVGNFGRSEVRWAPKQAGSWSIIALAEDPAGRTAFRLVAEVYRWFGYDDDYIPYTEISREGMIVSQQMIVNQHYR
jgi:hypothetical protein